MTVKFLIALLSIISSTSSADVSGTYNATVRKQPSFHQCELQIKVSVSGLTFTSSAANCINAEIPAIHAQISGDLNSSTGAALLDADRNEVGRISHNWFRYMANGIHFRILLPASSDSGEIYFSKHQPGKDTVELRGTVVKYP